MNTKWFQLSKRSRSFSTFVRNTTPEYDYLVIGGGSGGVASARRAATHPNTRVALIEKAKLGGTCVNVGCVPKKLMYLAANIQHTIARDAYHYGFEDKLGESLGNNTQFHWDKLKKRRDTYITRLNGIYERNLNNSNIDIITGTASFNADGQVQVDGKPIAAKNVLIAVGGRPMMPNFPGHEHCIDSDGFFALEKLPKKVAIIGAGYIAVELAGVLNGLGSDTTIFCRKEGVLRNFDEIIRNGLEEAMKHDGIILKSNSDISHVNLSSDGSKKDIALMGGSEYKDFDCVIVATGRVPLTENLNLSYANVDVNKNGFININEYQETSASNVFAVGDVCGKTALTPVAIAAGRRLADRLFGGKTHSDAKISYESIPTVVFSHPPIGTIGMTEAEAVTQYGKSGIKVYKSEFINMYYGLINEIDPTSNEVRSKPKTSMKLICVGPSEKIVGLHVIGMGADEMLQGFGVAIKMGATKKDFDNCIAIHPTAAEEFVTLSPWGLIGKH